jgi:hypothetical protein
MNVTRTYSVILPLNVADKMDRMAKTFNTRTDRLIAQLCEGLFTNPGVEARPPTDLSVCQHERQPLNMRADRQANDTGGTPGEKDNGEKG